MRHAALALAGVLLLPACDDDEIDWVPFNQEGQAITVEVLPEGSPAGEAATLELLSNLGRTVIGEAAVDPGAGPVGTRHLVTVDVLDEFEARVGRVTLYVDSEPVTDLDGDGDPDSRGNLVVEFRQDSADPGAWALEIESLGAADERREDVFTFVLWQADPLATTPGTTGTTE